MSPRQRGEPQAHSKRSGMKAAPYSQVSSSPGARSRFATSISVPTLVRLGSHAWFMKRVWSQQSTRSPRLSV